MIMQSLRGTYDILPEEIIYWNSVQKQAEALLINANYKQIQTPLIETKELFERSVGEGTDIVHKEMYSFEDQGGRKITLRPEGTASIARCFIEKKLYTQNTIQKLWYFGPMFRYERPQSGRQRQFHQLGIECLGIQDARADAEVISIAFNLLSNLNVGDFSLEINSIGNSQDRAKYKEELVKYLKKHENSLDKDSKVRLSINPLRILDSKDKKTQEILNTAPQLSNFLGEKSRQHFENLCVYLNCLNIPYNLNSKLVRGLDYYSDTAFEFKTKLLGSQDTICGGGRYDKLIDSLGGPFTPAVGWAIGIERLLLLIKQNTSLNFKNLDYYIAAENSMLCKIESIILFNELLKNNCRAEIDSLPGSLKKKITRCHKIQSNYCIIIGENEVKNGTIIIRNMLTKEQIACTREEFINNKIAKHKTLIAKNQI
uniref:histidine-tRNA synthetase n=1 Tax=Madagascaria erythrocladioides TaxID=753684 RepID=UPI001BF011AA|nr:histidine-tRNA synthetase [Madagascaria erythrocladioides]QUE29007.1 syh [Madagascaria erythrocladioides]UNJ16559.1 histidine-tRNA synthetase [Madagascaria erythrocladioides]